MGKKLQIALDVFTTKKALEILEQIHEYVDIIEAGSPLVVAEGMHAVREIRANYKDKMIYADTKIMDAGSILAQLAFDAGADMVSVSACTEDNTIKAAIDLAHKLGKACLVDMVAVKDIRSRARQLLKFKPDCFCTHVGYDIRQQNIDPVAELCSLEGIDIPKAIAGGITLSSMPSAIKSEASIIIVGEGIYRQPDMRSTAAKFHAYIEQS
jgi:3-hexulose-6-phosphate synthase